MENWAHRVKELLKNIEHSDIIITDYAKGRAEFRQINLKEVCDNF